MGVKAAVVAVVVMVVGVVVTPVVAAPQDDITLTSGGYSGVVVAISDQLDQTKCTQYVSSIKTMVEAASQLMFTATRSKVFFKDVVIVVPEAWACDGNFDTLTRGYSWDSAHLRVSPAHPVFGDHPWTQQPGGCGDPGDWIYVPENFLLVNTSYGSQGSVLVHEWAKYRWGVFEEYGHINDPIYPPAYLNQSSEKLPNYCTDQPVEGDLFCSGTEAECQFTPDLAANNTATSSLLAAPFLDTVVNFCDVNSHNTAVPTKQNLLCDKSSAWDVMNRHSDMQGGQNTLTNPNFSMVRATAAGPRLVFLLDYSSVMGEARGRWEQLRDNMVQYIMTEAADYNYVAVVVFTDQIVDYSPLYPLSVYANRVTLAGTIPSLPPNETPLVEKNLNSAITRGSELLGDEGGTMVLVTHNMVEYTRTDNLTAIAGDNAVWPILYPGDASVSTTIYDQLASISPDTFVLTVLDETSNIGGHLYQSVQNSAVLHKYLMTAAGNQEIRATSGSCTIVNCDIHLNMADSTEYISPAYIKVFFSINENLNYFKVDVKDPGGANILGDWNDTCILFPINTLQTGQYVVTVSESNIDSPVVAELWAIPAAPLGLQVSVWSSRGLHDLHSLPGMAPTLFAKVTNSESWPVLFADITGKVTTKEGTTVEGNITLNDAGLGGDVTGNDGIYSGYLVGFEPNMDISISLTVTDNNGAARVLNPSLRTAPTTPESNTCCGSQLDVSMLQLVDPGNFTLSPTPVSGRLTGEPHGTLPPGRVTDLRASRTGYDVTLTFTAPGGQLDQGAADEYEWEFQALNEERSVANFSGKPVGSTVTLQGELPGCDKVYTMTIVAISGGVRGGTSNSVREIVSCSYQPPGDNSLKAGAIAGITIGCILGVLLIVLIIYLCLNRDHLDELWVWYILTCGCLRKKEEDLYKQPTQARRTDVIRTNTSSSQPVRDLTDLYALPKMGTKSQQKKTEDEDDGGFGERRRRQEIPQRRVEDVESVASSHNTLPINKVGLPVGGDNHGYDDEPYSTYGNVPPPVRYPRANTQV